MKKSIKQQIAELPPQQQSLFPEINVEPEIKVEPLIEVHTPAADMRPIANALKAMKSQIDVHVPENKQPNIKLHFERDQRGFIKSPITIEREYEN